HFAIARHFSHRPSRMAGLEAVAARVSGLQAYDRNPRRISAEPLEAPLGLDLGVSLNGQFASSKSSCLKQGSSERVLRGCWVRRWRRRAAVRDELVTRTVPR